MDTSIFINQEDELFKQAGLIIPTNRPWLSQSLLMGPASLANFVQLTKYNQQQPILQYQELVNAVSEVHKVVLAEEGIDLRPGLTANKFISFSELFLKQLNLNIKFRGEYVGTGSGVDIDTLLSPEPSIIIVKFYDRGGRDLPSGEQHPAQKCFDPAMDSSGI